MTVESCSILWLIPGIPAVASAACLLARSPRHILMFVAAGGSVWSILTILFALSNALRDPISCADGWLYMDVLSAYQLAVLAFVFGSSSLYSWGYFRHESAKHGFSLSTARKFGTLWFGSAAAMTLVLLSNNLGLMWVGIEATTLLTGFLITIHLSPLSLEAMWKYLLVCSVGVAFALVGTLLVGASAHNGGITGTDMLMWTSLSESSGLLNPALVKLAFIFLIVGYGTKAGLAPMHSWLPDAHSQAPAPVSALFSGAMLNTALYCLMRYLPIVEGATGHTGWGSQMFVLFGLISILTASCFIIFQNDGKRLLAYSSVEHMGIIALGLGLGTLGAFVALWHTLNHSVCKSLSFFAIGRLGQAYGTHDLATIAGSARHVKLWGPTFLLSILVLIGVAPFAIFMSELQLVKAAFGNGSYISLSIFLAGTSIIFISALRHAIGAAWGHEIATPEKIERHLSDFVVASIGLAILALFGVFLPDFMGEILEKASAIVAGVE